MGDMKPVKCSECDSTVRLDDERVVRYCRTEMPKEVR